MTTLEIIGTIFALLGVWLTARQHVSCWAVAIISLIIYTYIFFKSQLYADSALQVFYLAASFYGWYEWLYGGKNKTELHVSQMAVKQIIYCLVAGTAGTLVLVYFLKMTDSKVPWSDSATASFSLVATWMMARKVIQNWTFWIIIDSAYVGLYIYKGLYVTSLQYFIFTLLAAYGYWQWRKELEVFHAKAQQADGSP